MLGTYVCKIQREIFQYNIVKFIGKKAYTDLKVPSLCSLESSAAKISTFSALDFPTFSARNLK